VSLSRNERYFQRFDVVGKVFKPQIHEQN
jgi:hypothetical protein